MSQQRKNVQNYLLIWIDAICLVASYIAACFLASVFRDFVFDFSSILSSLWMILLSYFLVFLSFNMNRYFMKRNKYEEIVYTVKLNLITGAVLIAVFYITKNTELISRSVWALTVLVNMVLMSVLHLVCKRILRTVFRSKKADHLLVLTTMNRIKSLIDDLKRYNTYENYLITLAIVDCNMVGEEIEGYRVVANCDTVIEVASREVVDEVFLVLDNQEMVAISGYAEQFAKMGILTHINIDMLDRLGAGYQREVTQIGNHYAISVAPRFFDFNKLVMKRIIDIVGAIVGLIITVVIMLFVAPAVKLESPGPLIFKQKRVGKNGRYFSIYKIRSMYQDAEARKAELMEKNEMKGFMFKMTNDPRITKVGKFIRSTSIDELPQFWNVLKGDMSLVGTRPPTVDEFNQYEAHHKRRLSMKPGLTGLWQVSGRSNIEDFEEVVRLDCEYIDNWSIQLDIQIILKTIVVIFKKVGSK